MTETAAAAASGPATPPVRVGVVGAGPWARRVHVPVFSAGPETAVSRVWSPSGTSAAALAAEAGLIAAGSLDELLAESDAVAICVPPPAQPEIAVRAARAGKAVLLEKPLALGIAEARRVADEVAAAGVPSLMGLTYRYAPHVRAFLAEAATFDASGGHGCFLSGAFLGGPYAGGWRSEVGALVDVGPHIIDLMDAALGPIEHMSGFGHSLNFVALTCRHASGAVSTIALSCAVAGEPSRTEVELYGGGGTLRCDARAGDRTAYFATLRAELAAAVRRAGRGGVGHPCDVERGVTLVRYVEMAERALASGSDP